jgi:hypothetical protein
MFKTPDVLPDNTTEEGRRRNRVGLLLLLVALVATAFAWTGLSLRDLLSALHF